MSQTKITYTAGNQVEAIRCSETLMNTIAPGVDDAALVSRLREFDKLLLVQLVMLMTGASVSTAATFVEQNTEDIS